MHNRTVQLRTCYSLAFSLVELSIVLVILGLLTGGILAGKTLIRAAELRSLSVDIARFRSSTYAFRDKYFALPGDMTNATDLWGIADGTTGNDTTCQTVISTDQKTCNGDGNGQIYAYESFRYFQHLANAGLIEGQFTGKGTNMNGGVQNGCSRGVNCPALRLNRATLKPGYSSSAGDVNYYPYAADNYYWVGSTYLNNGSTADNPLGEIMTTEEAWNFDTKIDDGLPNSGDVRVNYRNGSTYSWASSTSICSTTPNSDATYDLSLTGLSCAFRIKMFK